MSKRSSSNSVLVSGGRSQLSSASKQKTPSGGASGRTKIDSKTHAQAQAAAGAKEMAAASAVVASARASARPSAREPEQERERELSPDTYHNEQQQQQQQQQQAEADAANATHRSPLPRKKERLDPAEMKAAGLGNTGPLSAQSGGGVSSIMNGSPEFRKTATSVSREAYKELHGKPAAPFKPKASAQKDPIAHTDSTGLSAAQRAALDAQRFKSEANSTFVDHYSLHADQVHAGRPTKPAAIAASQQVRASGPFEGVSIAQSSFQSYAGANKEGPPKPFRPPPQNLELVKEDRDFQSVQRQQQNKTLELASKEGRVTVVRNTSNFRGTGAAAALSGGYDPALMKSVAQMSFSKFTAQQQLNAKARDPTAVNGHGGSPNTKPNKPSNANTNKPPNTDFTHVLHNEDAPLPAAAAAAVPAPATIAPPPQQSQGRASAPKAGASSNPEFNIISTLNSKEEKSWKAEHKEMTTSQQDFVHQSNVKPAQSFKPDTSKSAAATAAAINGKLDPKHNSQSWASEGHAKFQKPPQGAGPSHPAKPPQVAGPQIPFEGRSTAADSFQARPKRK